MSQYVYLNTNSNERAEKKLDQVNEKQAVSKKIITVDKSRSESKHGKRPVNEKKDDKKEDKKREERSEESIGLRFTSYKVCSEEENRLIQ